MQHIVHAAALMQQPRRHGGSLAMPSEASFVSALRSAVAEASPTNGLDARLVQLLADALQRLQRSSVLQAPRIDKGIASLDSKQQAIHQAAIEKSLNVPGLRRCALPGCGAREAHPAHFKSCAACRTVVYCCSTRWRAGPATKGVQGLGWTHSLKYE